MSSGEHDLGEPLRENSTRKCYTVRGESYASQQKKQIIDHDLLISQGVDAENVSFSYSNNGMQSSPNLKLVSEHHSQKLGTINDELYVISAEKSFAEASKKIMKIKQSNLENKNQLLSVENERLSDFLNDTVKETGRLNHQVNHYKTLIQQDQEKYQKKLNILLFDNEKLEDSTIKQQYRINDLICDKKSHVRTSENEIQGIHDQYASDHVLINLDYQAQKVTDAQNYVNQIDQLKEKLSKAESTITNNKRQLLQIMDEKKLLVDQIDNMKSSLNDKELTNKQCQKRVDQFEVENSNLNNRFKNQEIKSQMISNQLELKSNEYQKTIEQFEIQIKDLAHSGQQQLQDLNREHQIKVQEIRQNIFQDLNGQLTEIYAELGTKEQRIRSLEKDCLQQQQYIESSKRQEDQQDLMQRQDEQLHEQIELQLREIDSLRSKQDQLESIIVKHTKTMVMRGKSQKSQNSQYVELQREVQSTKKTLSETLETKETQINSHQCKLDIILSENETLQTQIRLQSRQYDTLSADVRTMNLDFTLILKNSLSELNNKKDAEFQSLRDEHQGLIKKQHKDMEVLEKRLLEQKQIRTSLETQISHIMLSEKEADLNAKETMKKCSHLERLNLVNQENCFNSSQVAIMATNKLTLLENNHQLERDDQRNQLLIAIEQYETVKLQNESYQQELTQTQTKYQKLRFDQDDLQKQHQKVQMDLIHNLDKNKLLEKDNKHNGLLVASQQLQIVNHQNEFKQASHTNNKLFKEQEGSLLHQIQEQSIQIEELTTRYNDVSHKARFTTHNKNIRKYQQHLKLLRDSIYTGQATGNLTTRRTMNDEIIDQQKQKPRLLKNSQSTTKINSKFNDHKQITMNTMVRPYSLSKT